MPNPFLETKKEQLIELEEELNRRLQYFEPEVGDPQSIEINDLLKDLKQTKPILDRIRKIHSIFYKLSLYADKYTHKTSASKE